MFVYDVRLVKFIIIIFNIYSSIHKSMTIGHKNELSELLALSGERTSERERDMKISYFSRQGVWVGPDMAGLVYAELDLVLQSIFSFYLRMQVLSSSFSDCICLYALCWISGFLFILANWSWIFMEIITWGTCQINHLGQKTSCFEVPGFVNLQSTDKVWLNFDQHSYNFVHLFSTIYTFFSTQSPPKIYRLFLKKMLQLQLSTTNFL